MTYSNPNIGSDEEEYASWFFEELKERGYVDEIIYQPKSFILAEPVSYVWEKPKPTKKEPYRIEPIRSNLLEGTIYTTDIEVHWNEKAHRIFFDINIPAIKGSGKFIAYLDSPSSPITSYIEVKPIFDDNNMTREVMLKHNWLYQRYGYYVNLFIRDKIMPKLFTPTRYILTQV